MTKIENLIRSSVDKKYKKNVLVFNTNYDEYFKNELKEFSVIPFRNFGIFHTYDTIIMNQSDIDNYLEKLYKKFLANIIIIDNVSYTMSQNNIQYWKQLANTYSFLNNTYNAIIVATNEYEYINSNYAHNFLIDPTNSDQWKSII